MPLLKCSPLIVRLWMPGLDQESSHLWKSRTTRVPAAASTSPPSSPRRCTPTAFPAPSTTCQVLQYKNNHTPYILLQGVWLLHREWTDNKYFNRAHSIHTPVHTYCWRYRNRMYLDMLRNCLNVAPNINCTKCHAQRGWIKFIWKVVWRLPPTVHVLKKKKRWIYLYNIISKYGMYFPSHIHPHCTCSPIKNTCDFGSRSIE